MHRLQQADGCREFLEPMLLVTLFAPASQLSAAAALAALYYFVLAHQVHRDHLLSAKQLLTVLITVHDRLIQHCQATHSPVSAGGNVCTCVHSKGNPILQCAFDILAARYIMHLAFKQQPSDSMVALLCPVCASCDVAPMSSTSEQ